jgi:hypothetical protein
MPLRNLRAACGARGRARIRQFGAILGAALVLAACTAPARPDATQPICPSSQHAGMAMLCCPQEDGRLICLLSQGGIEI